MTSAYDFTAIGIDGNPTPLDTWRGKVLLVVNVASKCGFTPQYEGLEQLHRELGPAGLAVLGFPCDQFGHQEPGDEAEIQSFCSLTYGVSFPMFAKVAVNGAQAHPLWAWLKKSQPGLLGLEGIKWNFTKFLVDREGRAVARYAPNDTPAKIRAAIERQLQG